MNGRDEYKPNDQRSVRDQPKLDLPIEDTHHLQERSSLNGKNGMNHSSETFPNGADDGDEDDGTFPSSAGGSSLGVPQGNRARTWSRPNLPEIPKEDFQISFEDILGTTLEEEPEVARVQKRASNVMKLSQENEKLNAELKAMADRLEAAERKREELERRMKQMGGGS
ncbi:hypothetical protein JAAARDRAFT_55503 [Jaapia argillacea MUCL 33604]|uniref:Uncharacterized protein n=1 Tax=Jaapia argillacea MUCL 33604 TaxID=933084 RepID=A0A067Q3N7_9AGAM|nr:hypothetical protein JAAARDRAFT_55503 [Jaapia argillacea MUCL 33604]